MRHSRLIAALSIPLGFVLGHLAAYTLASGGHSEVEAAAHSYLGSLSEGAVPMALFAVLIAVLQGRRRQEFTLRASTLIGQLVGVYLAIEFIEHFSVGVPLGEILTEKTLFVGIAVQVLVGFGLHRLLRAGHRLGELLAETSPPTFEVVTVLLVPSGQAVRSSSPRSSIRLRGPPAFALATSL